MTSSITGNKDIRKVEIVAPIFNRKELTLKCLRSISRLNSDGLEIHTVIVDDGSSDGSSDAIREQFPEVEVIRGDGNLWFTEGTNVGVRAALARDPDYVMMINDDQFFDADAVKFMVECAEKHPGSAVGSLLLLWDTPHKLFQVSPQWQTLSGGWRHWHFQTIWTIPEKPWEVDIIVGNCVMIPAEAMRKHGLMDSKRFPNCGDAEYTPRLRKAGWKLLIEPRARVFCQPNNALFPIRKMSIKRMANDLFFDLKQAHNLRRRWYTAMIGAPNKFQGACAFFIFFLRLIFGKNIESAWAYSLEEKPLKEVFADRIIK